MPRLANTVRSHSRAFVTAISLGARVSVNSQQLSLSVKRLPRSPYLCSRYEYFSHATLAARNAKSISSGVCGMA